MTEQYQVKFEKLPTFCHACGIMGHWHEECKTGEHDQTKFEWPPSYLLQREVGEEVVEGVRMEEVVGLIMSEIDPTDPSVGYPS